MYRSVTYNETGTGAQRQAVVGHLFDGLRVLAIGGDGGDVTIVRDGGVMTSIPAGSVVTCELADTPSPTPRREAAVRKQRSGDSGRRPAVVFHTGKPGQEQARTVAVGDVMEEHGSYVEAIILGDPVHILLKNNHVVEFSAGAMVKYLP